MHDREADRRRRLSPLAAGAALVVLLVPLAGCGDEPTETSTPDGSSVTTTTVAPGGVNALDHPERVPGLIRDHLGENPELRRLSLNANGFSVEVRDPRKRENMDDYDFYNGEWSTRPVSVSLSDIATFESVTFRLGDISWDAVPGLIRQALDGLDLEGEEVGGVSFDKLQDEPPRVYISVNGLRGTGRLIARADGTEVDVQRN